MGIHMKTHRTTIPLFRTYWLAKSGKDITPTATGHFLRDTWESHGETLARFEAESIEPTHEQAGILDENFQRIFNIPVNDLIEHGLADLIEQPETA